MAKPFKRPGSPYWQYDFQVNGQRLSGSTRTTSLAAARRIMEELRQEALLGKKAQSITLDDALGLYWRDVAERQPSAASTRSQSMSLIRGLGARSLLHEITQAHLVRHHAARRRVVTVATANRDIELARRVWRHAADQGARVSDVKWGRVIGKEPKERVREASEAEEEALLGALRADLRDFVTFAIASGQRFSSIANMTWDMVDFRNMTARVPVKGGGQHTFPLTAALADLIRSQPRVEDYPNVFTVVCKRTISGRVKGRRYPVTHTVLQQAMKAARREAGITDLRFHDLRHTAATRLLRKKGNLKMVQVLLGHANISTTARYAHVLVDDLRAAMEDT